MFDDDDRAIENEARHCTKGVNQIDLDHFVCCGYTADSVACCKLHGVALVMYAIRSTHRSRKTETARHAIDTKRYPTDPRRCSAA